MSNDDQPNRDGETFGRAGGYNSQPGESAGEFAEPRAGGAVPEGGEYTGQTGTGYGRLPGTEGATTRDVVAERLAADPFLDASGVQVLMEGDEITLEGSVTAKADRKRAEHIAEETEGVRRVHNRLSYTDKSPE